MDSQGREIRHCSVSSQIRSRPRLSPLPPGYYRPGHYLLCVLRPSGLLFTLGEGGWVDHHDVGVGVFLSLVHGVCSSRGLLESEALQRKNLEKNLR